MSIVSRLKTENRGILAAFVFYAIVGVVFLVLLFTAWFPPHVGIIGVFSLVAAYGMFTKRNWTIWFVTVLFFVATTFSACMLYYYLPRDYLLSAALIAYLVLTWVFTAYAAMKRKSLEG